MQFVYSLLTLLFIHIICGTTAHKKKSLADYTEKDLEDLYEQWEENDEEELPDDEKPPHLRPKPDIDFDKLKSVSKDPEDMIRLSKKGQTIMMFVAVVDPMTGEKASKALSTRMSTIWQSMLGNNHIEVQMFVVDDDRILMMFSDGSRAWEARDVLLKQKECKDVTLEGKTMQGVGSTLSASKSEL